jgi:hypothetical protein
MNWYDFINRKSDKTPDEIISNPNPPESIVYYHADDANTIIDHLRKENAELRLMVAVLKQTIDEQRLVINAAAKWGKI